MRRVRVEIGTLIVHHPSLAPSQGAALGRMVEANLKQLWLVRGGSAELHNSEQVLAHASLPAGAGASPSAIARAVAHAVHRSVGGKR